MHLWITNLAKEKLGVHMRCLHHLLFFLFVFWLLNSGIIKNNRPAYPSSLHPKTFSVVSSFLHPLSCISTIHMFKLSEHCSSTFIAPQPELCLRYSDLQTMHHSRSYLSLSFCHKSSLILVFTRSTLPTLSSSPTTALDGWSNLFKAYLTSLSLLFAPLSLIHTNVFCLPSTLFDSSSLQCTPPPLTTEIIRDVQ